MKEDFAWGLYFFFKSHLGLGLVVALVGVQVQTGCVHAARCLHDICAHV